MDWITIVSLIVGFIGGGAGLAGLITLRAQKEKAEAEAKGAEASAESTEIDNVDKAAKMWRELAEKMESRNADLQASYDALFGKTTALLTEVEKLRKDVCRQNATMNKILKILDSIDHENLEQKVAEVKEVAGQQHTRNEKD